MNQVIYEINTRVWINRFKSRNQRLKIHQVPVEYWKNLKEHGIDYIWLMGIWELKTEYVEKYCLEPGLVGEYRRILPDLKKEDVAGSPYAINSYKVNPDLGDEKDLLKLKEILNKTGLKLLLDFIPNHFHAQSDIIKTNPEIFLRTDPVTFSQYSSYFYKPDQTDVYFANGRDPYFPSWKDTVQINYFSEKAHKFMTDQLMYISGFCDGVRCDMAMLALNDVFERTWGPIIESEELVRPDNEFWAGAISTVKKDRPDFKFLAEAYWGLETELYNLGFDYAYDKNLYDHLHHENTIGIREHITHNLSLQNRFVRFIENHDEQRAIIKFGPLKSLTAAVLAFTLPGIKLLHDGQFEGRKLKLPVQLIREPEEEINLNTENFYEILLSIIRNDVFRFGEWTYLTPLPRGIGDFTFKNMLLWKWEYRNEFRLVAINYSQFISSCHIKFDFTSHGANVNFYDELNDVYYFRNTENLKNVGLYIELQGFHAHILKLV